MCALSANGSRVDGKRTGGGAIGGRGWSDVELMSSQAVHEGLNHEAGGEVEDEAESDGDGQRRQGLLKDGEQQQRQAQTLGEGHR